MALTFRYTGPDGEGTAGLPPGCAAAVGSEYCVHLLPGEEELARAIVASRERGLPLLLLTPYVRDSELKKAVALFRSIPRDAAVIVAVNDWGVLHAAGILTPWLDLTVGRLLSGQKRCPRIEESARLTPDGKALQGEGVFSSRRATEYLRSVYRVSGYHADLLPHGPGLCEEDAAGSARGSRPSLFVHAPFALVTVSDGCPWLGGRSSAAVPSCPRPCRNAAVRLREPSMGCDLIQRGKARFVDYGMPDETARERRSSRPLVMYPETP